MSNKFSIFLFLQAHSLEEECWLATFTITSEAEANSLGTA